MMDLVQWTSKKNPETGIPSRSAWHHARTSAGLCVIMHAVMTPPWYQDVMYMRQLSTCRQLPHRLGDGLGFRV